MPQLNETPRIAVILAGGGGRRMGGADKGALELGGRRLVDHVIARLAPQTDRLLISGRHDYGSGLTVIGDREDGPRGPAAGLWAALKWIEENAPGAGGFLTAPVDGPFTKPDLFARLSGAVGSAIACDETGVHPTFAYWRNNDLWAALEAAPEGFGYPLMELSDVVKAERIMFDDANAFLNINTPEELVRAEPLATG